MSREWKPGDVALVRNEYGVWNRAIRQVAASGDEWQYGVARATAPGDAEARPLVVIDPEDCEQVEQLVRAMPDAWNLAVEYELGDSIRHVQAALRSLVAEPEPEEPTGLGAVVKDGRGWRWMRRGGFGYRWIVADPVSTNEPEVAWAGLERPITVLSLGWEPES